MARSYDLTVNCVTDVCRAIDLGWRDITMASLDDVQAAPAEQDAARPAGRQRLPRVLLGLIDVLLAPFALCGAVAGLALAKRPNDLSICRRIFDGFSVFPIRHHYYSPLVYASDLKASLDDERVIEGLDLDPAGQLALVAQFAYRAELLAIPRQKTGRAAFGYDNSMFGPGDAEYLYNMIRHFKPKRILEIGSGESTLMAWLAIEANRRDDAEYRCQQTCVEPFEAPFLAQIDVTLLCAKIEDLAPSVVDELEANDILFIDSSHVIRPQGDVIHEYLTLLGRLKPGVLVHVHDIRTPRDYFPSWVLRDRRLWNEQYLLEAFLCFNRDFAVIGAVNWLRHNHSDKLATACPVLCATPDHEPGSFWMMRVGNPER